MINTSLQKCGYIQSINTEKWVVNNNGSLAIQFQLNGKTYKFSPIKRGKYDDPIAKGKAIAIAQRIALDIKEGIFDTSVPPSVALSKYKPIPTPYGRTAADAIRDLQEAKEEVAKLNPKLLPIWDSWVESLGLPEATKNDHYRYIRRMIEHYGGSEVTINDTGWFTKLQASLSHRTYNERLSYISSCVTWATEQRLFTGKNAWLRVKPMKQVQTEDHVKPFTKDEISRIVEALETNQFCAKGNHAFKHSHYAPLVKFLFATGCRISEAIALQWKHVDFERRQICICESLSRDLSDKGNGYRRVRKSTKTGNIRYLPLTEGLQKLLLAKKSKDCQPNDLVFPSFTGKNIEPNNFRKRVWAKVLEGLGIEYRYPYQTRHTLLSHVAMEYNLPMAAAIAGHKDLTMVQKNYARFVGNIELPNLI